MTLLNYNFDTSNFWNRLSHIDKGQKNILMLDYDGTLSAFVENRDDARPYEGIVDILNLIASSGRTKIIIVTGRNVSEIPKLLPLTIQPEVWGSHGYEHLLSDGTIEINKQVKPIQLEGLRVAKNLEISLKHSELLEIKPGALSVHFRKVPSNLKDEIYNNFEKEYSALASTHNLILTNFEEGLELRIPGIDKGVVVKKIIAENGKNNSYAYLGDDLTDEDAFCVLKELNCYNKISVLVRSNIRKTNADIWLKPPEELFKFLEQWKYQQNKGTLK